MKARKLQTKRLTTCNVKLETRRPEIWLKYAQEWGIDIHHFTIQNLLSIIQYRIHEHPCKSYAEYCKRVTTIPGPTADVAPPPVTAAITVEDTRKLLGEDVVGKSTTVNYCAKCMRPVKTEVTQSRSADEGMDTTYICPQCGKTSIYNRDGHDYQDDEPEELGLPFT